MIAVIAFSILYTGSELLTIPVARGLSCFFSGALSYVLFSRVRGLAKLGLFWMTALEISSLVAVVVVITSGLENKSLLASFLFCVVVVIFAFDGGAVSKLFKKNLFSFAGKISYSIYLTHASVLLCFFFCLHGCAKNFWVKPDSYGEWSAVYRYRQLPGQ